MVQLPGRATRITEPPLDNMQLVVEALSEFAAELTAVPYVFFGHSLGSRIAFELALSLQKSGYRLPNHLIASGSRAAHLPREQKQTYLLPDDEFIRALSQLNGTPAAVLQNRELLDMLLPMLRADFKIAECYQAGNTQLHADFTVLAGTLDKDVNYEDALAWRELSQKSCTVKQISGDHFFIDSQPQSVIDEVVKVLEKELNKMVPAIA